MRSGSPPHRQSNACLERHECDACFRVRVLFLIVYPGMTNIGNGWRPLPLKIHILKPSPGSLLHVSTALVVRRKGAGFHLRKTNKRWQPHCLGLWKSCQL
jgi:hypothetical protein